MKIRQGFVSNSSSSSFILFLERVPEKWEDVAEMLYGRTEGNLPHPYDDDNEYSVQKAAEAIFYQIEDGAMISKNEVIRMYDVPDSPDSSLFKAECLKKDNYTPSNHKEYNRLNDFLSKKRLKDLFERTKGKKFYCVEFSDDEPFGCFMEHGDHFDAIEHIKISNH